MSTDWIMLDPVTMTEFEDDLICPWTKEADRTDKFV